MDYMETQQLPGLLRARKNSTGTETGLTYLFLRDLFLILNPVITMHDIVNYKKIVTFNGKGFTESNNR